MALSYTQWQGDGVTQSFPISFQYIAKEHVSAVVNLDPVAFTWDDDNTIRISPAPANGAVVEARRTTPRAERLVDFSDGSTLTESDLDLAQIQTFYIVQEAIDIAGGTLELKSDGSYGAGGRRIAEMGNPTAARDAVTKEWAETAMSSQLAQAIAAMNAAVAAKDAAQASQGAAADSASTATTQAGLADAARVAAQAARDAALAYRDSALAHRDAAQGFRNESQGFRNEAEGFKNAAAASAAAAATYDPALHLLKASNFSDVPNKATARSNLKLAWEVVDDVTLSANSPDFWINLGGATYRRLRISGDIIIVGANANTLMRFSTDNRNSVKFGGSDYVFNLTYNDGTQYGQVATIPTSYIYATMFLNAAAPDIGCSFVYQATQGGAGRRFRGRIDHSQYCGDGKFYVGATQALANFQGAVTDALFQVSAAGAYFAPGTNVLVEGMR